MGGWQADLKIDRAHLRDLWRLLETVTFLNRDAAFAYDAAGQLAETVELPGHATLQRRTTYQYDALGRQTRETVNSDGNDASTTVDERVSKTHYDAAGNVTKVDQNPGADPRAIATTFKYDALGQMIEETQSGLVAGVTENRTTRYRYDAAGHVVATTDPLGRTSKSEYDRLDRVTKSTDPDPDGSGSGIAHATTFQYDVAGNLVGETNGAGDAQIFAYDPQGRLVRSADGRGDATLRRGSANWRINHGSTTAAGPPIRRSSASRRATTRQAGSIPRSPTGAGGLSKCRFYVVVVAPGRQLLRDINHSFA